jgi:hypothetical protein
MQHNQRYTALIEGEGRWYTIYGQQLLLWSPQLVKPLIEQQSGSALKPYSRKQSMCVNNQW